MQGLGTSIAAIRMDAREAQVPSLRGVRTVRRVLRFEAAERSWVRHSRKRGQRFVCSSSGSRAAASLLYHL